MYKRQLNTEDGELTRTGVLNKTRQSQINLSHQLTAMDQALYAQQFIEQERLADLTRQGAVEARQQGRAAEARALETQADANARRQGHVRNFFYADYRTGKDGYDEDQLNADLKLSLVAREYRGLQPETFINRGDARGGLAIDLMLALVVTAGSLLLFGLAIMDGVTAYAIARPGYVALAIVAAYAFNLLLQVAGGLAFRHLGATRALTVALLAGNCNMGLVLVALQGRASFDVTVFFALAQIPMYTLPALMKPVYARLTAGRASPR